MQRFHSLGVVGLVAATAILAAAARIGAEEPKTDELKKKDPTAKPLKDLAEKKDATAKGPPAELSAEDEAWMKASMPGPEHKQLEYMVGTWNVAARFWHAPDAPPEESSAKSKGRWVLGERFVHYQFTGDVMGMPFEGSGYTGYDNVQKKYVSVWMDTMTTGFMTDKGSYDPSAKTFHFTGEFLDPLGAKIKSRTTIHVVSRDEHVMTMYNTKAGAAEAKMMELVYKRAAGGALFDGAEKVKLKTPEPVKAAPAKAATPAKPPATLELKKNP